MKRYRVVRHVGTIARGTAVMSGLSRAPQGDPDKQAGPTSVTSSATTSVSYSLRSRSSTDRSLLPPTHILSDPVPGGSALPDNKLNKCVPAGPSGPHQGPPAVAGSPIHSPSDTAAIFTDGTIWSIIGDLLIVKSP